MLLAAVIREHRTAVTAHAVRLTGSDRAWAEDVVQETFLRAWHRIDRMTAAHGSVRSWLLRVAHNLVVDGYRSARNRATEIDLEAAPPASVPDDSEQVLAAVVLAGALRELPEEHRVALELTYLHDRTAAQAAQLLGVPVGTVKSRVFYGLRRLRATVDPAAA